MDSMKPLNEDQEAQDLLRSSLSLEELRRQQTDWSNRRLPKYEKTDFETAYWQKVRETKPRSNGMDKHQSGAIQLPLMDVDNARRYINIELQKSYGEKLHFSSKNIPVIRELTLYFSGNKGKLDLDKGIYLFGPVGTGKTSLMKIMQGFARQNNYPTRMFAISSIPDIYNKVRKDSQFELEKLTFFPRLFDDIGFSVPEIMHYGTRIKPLEYLLFERYNKFKAHGMLTHITSNLPPDKLEVDLRIQSRMKEMFNFVLLDGEDLRCI